MDIKKLIQVILLVWFIAINVAILVPSYQLLFGRDADDAADGQPPPPNPPATPRLAAAIGPLDPALDIEKQRQQVETYKQQVGTYAEQIKAYTQEVSAYTQQLAAHKARAEAKTRTNRLAVYEAVVKNSLTTLVSGFVTAIITYVFANLGAGVVDNIIRVRNGAPPESLKLL